MYTVSSMTGNIRDLAGVVFFFFFVASERVVAFDGWLHTRLIICDSYELGLHVVFAFA